jgi:hypothetical protein
VTTATSRDDVQIAIFGAGKEEVEEVYEGDFAGYTATYSWPQGRLVPLPEHLVPPELVEWGQVPTGLEILTSEGGGTDDDNATRIRISSSSATVPVPSPFPWSRHTLTVLPATGCAVDSLHTTRSSVTHLIKGAAVPAAAGPLSAGATAVRILVYRAGDNSAEVEVTFDLSDLDVGQDKDDDEEGESHPWSGHRVRLAVPVELQGASPEWMVVRPASALKATVERRVSERSSRGKAADGGGLDGATVSRWIGPHLRDLQATNRLFYASGDVDHDRGSANGTGDSVVAVSGKAVALPLNLTLSVTDHVCWCDEPLPSRDDYGSSTSAEGLAPLESASGRRALMLEVSRDIAVPSFMGEQPRAASGSGTTPSKGCRCILHLVAKVLIRTPSTSGTSEALSLEDASRRHLLDPANYRFDVRCEAVGSGPGTRAE